MYLLSRKRFQLYWNSVSPIPDFVKNVGHLSAVTVLILFIIIASEVSVANAPTLLVDSTPHSGELMLAGNILPWVPILIYILLDIRKKKKAAADC